MIKNKEINPEIITKVKESNQPDNVKEFIFKLLDLEYEKRDEERPAMKDPYVKLIKKYKEAK